MCLLRQKDAMAMSCDGNALTEAITELARLKEPAGETTGILPRLYASALEEWATRLGLDADELDRRVSEAREIAPGR